MSKWVLTYDVAGVLVFVVAGRANHGSEETVTGILHTAGPFLIALVLGGIYGGIFTATEAGGIGALGALVLTFFKGQLTRGNFWEAKYNSC